MIELLLKARRHGVSLTLLLLAIPAVAAVLVVVGENPALSAAEGDAYVAQPPTMFERPQSSSESGRSRNLDLPKEVEPSSLRLMYQEAPGTEIYAALADEGRQVCLLVFVMRLADSHVADVRMPNLTPVSAPLCGDFEDFGEQGISMSLAIEPSFMLRVAMIPDGYAESARKEYPVPHPNLIVFDSDDGPPTDATMVSIVPDQNSAADVPPLRVTLYGRDSRPPSERP